MFLDWLAANYITVIAVCCVALIVGLAAWYLFKPKKSKTCTG